MTKRDRRPPEPAELARLAEAAEAAEDRLTALGALAIYSGCRQGELLALSWADVELDRATLTVRRNLVRVQQQMPQFGSPKSETSRRTISLPAAAIAALRAQKARQTAERLAAAAEQLLLDLDGAGEHCRGGTRPDHRATARRGRAAHQTRPVLGGVRWIVHRHASWRTIYAHYRLWRQSGLWPQLPQALDELAGRLRVAL